MKNLIIILSIILISTPAIAETYTVERVIDGDTIVVTTPEGKSETVLLIGIDAPESNIYKQRAISNETGQDLQTLIKMGQEATDFVKGLKIEGKEVRLEFDVQERDKYGRLLAYVFVDTLFPLQMDMPVAAEQALHYLIAHEDHYDIFVNASIIKAGYATPMTILPNVKNADLFKELYDEAREQKRGLWRENVVKGRLKNTAEPDFGSGTGGVSIIEEHVDTKDLSPEVKKLLIDSGTRNIPPPCPEGTHLEGEYCKRGLWKDE